jgi:hypothetical protein
MSTPLSNQYPSGERRDAAPPVAKRVWPVGGRQIEGGADEGRVVADLTDVLAVGAFMKVLMPAKAG